MENKKASCCEVKWHAWVIVISFSVIFSHLLMMHWGGYWLSESPFSSLRTFYLVSGLYIFPTIFFNVAMWGGVYIITKNSKLFDRVDKKEHIQ